MSKVIPLLLWVLVFLATSLAETGVPHSNTSNWPSIIIDTDVYADVDDIGALAIANVLHNCGFCDLKGVAINTHSRYGALVTSAVNTYFGNGAVPVAALRPLSDDIYVDRHFYLRGDYASKVAMNFPYTIGNVEDTKTPLEMYLHVLETAEDDSITIISIGFLTNLAALLHSPEAVRLIISKVCKLVVMGGTYPAGKEYNFAKGDSASAAKVVKDWPSSVPITYVGFEMGINILSGHHMRENAPPDSPVLAAYEWFIGRCSTVREPWDSIAVLYGVFGLGGMDKISGRPLFVYANEYGYNSIAAESGSNAWVNDPSVTNQHWLELANGVTNETAGDFMTSFFAMSKDDCPALQVHDEL